MTKVKLSLIITVYDEQSTILRFIESVINQTKLPDEFIIVDGGSRDSTVAKIKSQKSKVKNYIGRFEIIVKKGNRSVGRNEAIRSAKGDIILCTDAGCLLDRGWMKNITKPFTDSKIDVVAGYYKGKSDTIFQKCLVPYVLVMPDKVDPYNFLPATRSMALRKSIWEKVGGFPEEYSHNEDYVFSKKLKSAHVNIVFKKDAIVYWIPRKKIWESFIMFFRFAKGDSEAGIYRPKVIAIFVRYLLTLFLLLIFIKTNSDFILNVLYLMLFVYIFWSIAKNYRHIKHWKAIFYLPLIQFISDIAVIFGTTSSINKLVFYSRNKT